MVLDLLLQAVTNPMGVVDVILQFGDALLSMALLGYWVYTLNNTVETKESKIDELNSYILQNNTENLNTLSEFSKFLETLIINTDRNKDDVTKEIHASAESVKAKLDNLKTIIKQTQK